MPKKDELLKTYENKAEYGRITFYAKDKKETTAIVGKLAEELGVKKYEVIDYLIRKEMKERGLTVAA